MAAPDVLETYDNQVADGLETDHATSSDSADQQGGSEITNAESDSRTTTSLETTVQAEESHAERSDHDLEQGAAQSEPPPSGSQHGIRKCSDEKIVALLWQILRAADLDEMTEKKLRKQLEGHLGVDLSQKKTLIKGEVMKFLEKKEKDRVERNRKRSSDALLRECALSPALQQFLGKQTCSRPTVHKLVHKYIEENGLQEASDRRKVIVDDKLATLFPRENVTTFNMKKYLANHIFTLPKGALRKAKKVKTVKPPEPVIQRPPDWRSRQITCDAELKAFLGVSKCTVSELSKYTLAYVDELGLRDPDNSLMIVNDEPLRRLTGKERISIFSICRELKPHFSFPDEEPQEYEYVDPGMAHELERLERNERRLQRRLRGRS